MFCRFAVHIGNFQIEGYKKRSIPSAAYALRCCLARWDGLSGHPHAYGVGLIIVILSLRVAKLVSSRM